MFHTEFESMFMTISTHNFTCLAQWFINYCHQTKCYILFKQVLSHKI